MKKHGISLHLFGVVMLITSFCSCEKRLINRQSAISDEENTVRLAGRPNIIVILGDDIGYEIPAINGGRSYATTNLDRLASNGMRFTQCRAAAMCSPTRFMLLTGKYNFRNYTIWGQMDTSQQTIGNMLRDAGYATCYAGKWQLDGGDNSIRKFGFDKYSVWLPYKVCPEEAEGSRYKSASIYQNAAYLPRSVTSNKYSDDIFSEYVLKFMDSNSQQPFFVLYSMILCHKAYSPPPDDPEYQSWNPAPENSDTAFFPSMVSYMDKKIGLILNKINSLRLANNTIVIFAGDNGTPKDIYSKYKNTIIQGGKGISKEYGIHVPLFCTWPGVIQPGKVNSNLIDFTDFLPTLADIANIPVPLHYGILDGLSFYPQLTGTAGTVRSSVFCQFKPATCLQTNKFARYAQDSIYKLYDDGSFYKFKTDADELNPLADSALTKKQKHIKQNLQTVISAMHN